MLARNSPGECGSTASRRLASSGRAAIRQICAQPAKNRWSPVIPSMTGDSSSPRAIR
jgi:hypothetical protein